MIIEMELVNGVYVAIPSKKSYTWTSAPRAGKTRFAEEWIARTVRTKRDVKINELLTADDIDWGDPGGN